MIRWLLRFSGVLYLLLLLLPAQSFAELEEVDTRASLSPHMTSIGLGAAVAPDYEGSNDATTVPLFLLQSRFASGRFIDVLGNRAKVNLVPSQKFSLGPILQYRASRDDNVEDDQVKRMKEIDGAVEAGIFGGIAINNWLASLQVTQDVSDTHDGTLATLSGGYRYHINKVLTILPTLSATWASSDYMDTYFGVNSGNRGTSTLPDFKAESGIKDIALAMIADYHPWQHWKIVGGVGYKKLLGDAKDSPLVDGRGSSNQLVVGVILAYQWGSQ